MPAVRLSAELFPAAGPANPTQFAVSYSALPSKSLLPTAIVAHSPASRLARPIIPA